MSPRSCENSLTHSEPIAAAATLADELKDFTPTHGGSDWEQVRPLVLDAVAVRAPGVRETRRVLQVTAGFVLWCVRERGIPARASELFRLELIDAYVTTAVSNENTQGTYRSLLVPVADAVLPGQSRDLLTPLGRSAIRPPYTDRELRQFRTWVRNQATPMRRERAGMLLALGAGAGLTAAELFRMRRDDVTTDQHGILLRVENHDAQVRTVPLLAAWEELLRESVKTRKRGDWLWTTDRATTDKNALHRFTISSGEPAPNLSRLRTTWLLTHLRVGTPMPALFTASGMHRWDNLHQYLGLLDPLPTNKYRAHLRGPLAE